LFAIVNVVFEIEVDLPVTQTRQSRHVCLSTESSSHLASIFVINCFSGRILAKS